MSTTTEPGVTPPAVAVGNDDPFRYGWRYLRHESPDGTMSYEEVPLKKEDLLFPEEGDRVLNTDGHNSDCSYLRDVFKAWAAGLPDALAFHDHRIDWGVAGVRPLGPDVVVFRGVREPWDPFRGTFPVARFGARTLLVIEVTSPDTRDNDVGIKVDLYHRVGVQFYAIVDRPEARGAPDLRLIGYHADPTNPDHYTEVPPDDRGRLWLEPVRLWLAIEQGRAVCYDEQGRCLMEYAALDQEQRAAETRATAEAQARRLAEERAAAAEARLKELEAELQRRQGNS